MGEAPRADPPVRLRELALLFLRLGLISFGGPVAHIALMREEIVRRRGWIDDGQFLDMVGATNLVPGPNSTELALLLGKRRGGWAGLLLAAIGFIVPAAVIVTVLAWAYTSYGSTPPIQGLLAGVKPVVIAIVVVAIGGLARRLSADPFLIAVAVAAAIAYLLGGNELLLLAAGTGAVVVVRGWTGIIGRRAAALLALGGTTGGASAVASAITLPGIFWVFLKVGALIYGSGYVLLAFLRADLVERLGWLTDQQLLDAVAIGQTTPGPVFTTATFVGYVLAGAPGALVATVAIFLPAFVFVALLERIVRAARRRPWSAAALAGINAASLGLMAGVTVILARDALLPTGSPDAVAVCLALAAAVLLGFGRLGPTLLVILGAAVGIVRIAAGV